MENKDFYVIELRQKIKVGITQDFKSRFNNIKTGSGIKDNEIINVYHYPDLSSLESRIKRLFSKQNIAGEWFYKKEIVLDFVESLKEGHVPSIDLLKKIKNNSVKYSNVFKTGDFPYENYAILKENAINLLEQIKSERRGIGYPDSIDLAKFMRTKRANYRNMVYYADDDFKYFERKPSFSIENIKNNQIIECLRIIRNTTANNKIKDLLQDYIDSIFAERDIYIVKITEIIRSFFFDSHNSNNELFIETDISYSNIEMELDKELNVYSLSRYFENLNKDELLFLKNAKNHNLRVSIFGNIDFDYKERFCFCFFEVENYLRVLNFLSITRLDENGVRLFFNDTDKYSKSYIFQYKYHLLNSSEKEFISSLEVKDVSFCYIEFEKDKQTYYCLFDDIEVVCKELKIKLDKNTKVKVEAEPFNDESSYIADIIESEKQIKDGCFIQISSRSQLDNFLNNLS